MIELSEQIRIMEEARALYAAHPNHAPRHVTHITKGVCVNTAISRVCPHGQWLEMQLVFAMAIDDDACEATLLFRTVVFNELRSTEEVLAVFDQVISELKAKVITDELMLQVS